MLFFGVGGSRGGSRQRCPNNDTTLWLQNSWLVVFMRAFQLPSKHLPVRFQNWEILHTPKLVLVNVLPQKQKVARGAVRRYQEAPLSLGHFPTSNKTHLSQQQCLSSWRRFRCTGYTNATAFLTIFVSQLPCFSMSQNPQAPFVVNQKDRLDGRLTESIRH